MSINVTCGGCGKQFRVVDAMAGKVAKCPCGERLQIPSPEAESESDALLKALAADASQPVATPAAPVSPFQQNTPTPNAYVSPQTNLGSARRSPATRSLPTLCTTMFIIDLIFCIIRVPLVALSVFAVGTIPESDPLAPTVWAEILTGGAIALLGIPAAGFALSRKPVAVPLGFAVLVATAASLLVGLWQMTLMSDLPVNQAEATGRWIGIILALGVRGGVNLLYLVALLKLSAWFKSA